MLLLYLKSFVWFALGWSLGINMSKVTLLFVNLVFTNHQVYSIALPKEFPLGDE